MKRAILLVLMLLPMTAMAGIPELSNLMKSYDGKEGATVVTINKEMMSLFAGGEAAAEAVDQIDMLVVEDGDIVSTVITEATDILQLINMPLMTTVTDDDANINIYVRQDGDVICDMVLIVSEYEAAVLMVISGEMSEEMIGELVQIGM